MSTTSPDPASSASTLEVAQALVDGRFRRSSRAGFPGRLPASLAQAYEIQCVATELWRDEIAGWKVGRILGEEAAAFGEDRFIGPIFASSVTCAAGEATSEFPMIAGGAACFEAEIVAIVGRDAPRDRRVWTVDEAVAFIERFQLGVEIAGSSVRDLGTMGAAAQIAAFGNNLGLLLGPALTVEALARLGEVHCATFRDGAPVREGRASSLPGGPLAAVAFAFAKAAMLDRPLRAGQLISTGAITGVHPVGPGEHWTADFGPHGAISCCVREQGGAG